MRNSTKNIAAEMGITPIPFWTAIKMLLRGQKLGVCFGFKIGNNMRSWRTK